ncbi:hypothetical protein CC86DRAFT_303644 [Ophiobolus disseminans]|uniref:Glycosyltransferase family 1 protein n=1 Tax=Ophiobolus disseminans TaxID=1469910 RepID=A0A6A6ZK02_9PLEO|nr:hypothetical protein CC86DRAFT_303644 [Ophiobolus disseminans]
MVHVETQSNADLYTLTPPAYTQSLNANERTIDAEAIQEEKSTHVLERSPERDVLAQNSPRPTSERSTARPETPLHVLQDRARENTAPIMPSGSPPVLGHYLTEPATTAALVGVRACSILQDRPAIWLVKNKKMALSPLAAAVLTKEGILNPKNLELISQHPSTRRDPTDPVSGILLGVHDSVGEIMLGLVAGPVELGRQATPMLTRFESRQRSNPDGNTQPITTSDVKNAPQAAGKVALEAGKGMGRIVTASLKTPVLTLHGLTRGFHNMPKAWGEEVREYQNITGFRSGMTVSAKSFGYGLGDGLTDLFAKPMQGAAKNGIVGLATGMVKGVGNAVCKPAAGYALVDEAVLGACGLLGYPAVGVYKSIRNIKVSNREICPADLVWKFGQAEFDAATDADKLYIVRVWCQTMMRVRLA